MTPYEELFNTASNSCIVHADSRSDAAAFAQNLYQALVRKWGIPKDRVSLYPPFGGFSPNTTYSPAEATVERPGGGWSLGVQVAFAPTDADNSSLPAAETAVTTRIRIDFAYEDGAYTVGGATNTDLRIEPDTPSDYEAFADELFAVINALFAKEEISEATRKYGLSIVVQPTCGNASNRKSFMESFPVIEEAAWSDDISLRREDMYDDSGR